MRARHEKVHRKKMSRLESRLPFDDGRDIYRRSLWVFFCRLTVEHAHGPERLAEEQRLGVVDGAAAVADDAAAGRLLFVGAQGHRDHRRSSARIRGAHPSVSVVDVVT